MAETFSATSQTPTVTNNPSFTEKALVFINVAAQAPLRLTPDNYMAWHSQWYSLLIGYDIMDYVDGKTACPPTTDSHHHFWTRQDHLLRSALIASLSPDLVNFVAATQSSRETWLKLSTMYAKPSRGRIMGLRESLSKTVKESRTIAEYMQAITRLADSLALAGEPLGSDEIVFHVLNGLGGDYKEISAALRARDTPISFAELHDKLADYEAFLNRNKPASLSPLPVTANYAKNGGKSSGTKGTHLSTGSTSFNTSKGATRPTNKIICQFCNIPGHSARTCRKIFAAAPWLNQSVGPWTSYS